MSLSALSEAGPALPLPRRRLILVTLLAWLAIIEIDLLLNAALLARFYDWQLPGFLPPIKMFEYIPLGYAAFLLWSVLMTWLLVQGKVTGFHAGAAFGAKFGFLFGLSAFLGAKSLYAFPTRMLLCWSVDYLLYFTLAGAVIGSGLVAPRLRALTFRVVGAFLACLVIIVALQSLGLVPVVRTPYGPVGIGWDPNR